MKEHVDVKEELENELDQGFMEMYYRGYGSERLRVLGFCGV